jgi:hypothetical protein
MMEYKIKLLIALGFGIISLSIVKLLTQDYIINVSTDSAHYHAIAYSFSQGKGFLSYNNSYPTVWPPLYPMVLGLIHWLTRIDIITISHGLNLFIAFSIGTISFLFLSQYVGILFACIGTAFITFTPLLNTFILTYLWSETLYVLLCLLQIVTLSAYLKQNKIHYLSIACIFTSLAVMTRYIGVINIVLLGLCLLHHYRKSLIKGLTITLTACGVTSLPLILWMMRNYAIDGTYLGPRSPSISWFMDNVNTWFSTIEKWFYNPSYGILNHINQLMMALVISLFIYQLFRKKPSDKTQSLSYSTISIVFFINYSIFIIYSSTRYFYDIIGPRLLSPIYIPIIFFGIYIYHQVFLYLRSFRSQLVQLLAYLVPTSLIILMIPLVISTVDIMSNSYHNTLSSYGGINAGELRNSELIIHLIQDLNLLTQEQQKPITIYTNQEDILGFYLFSYAINNDVQILDIPRANELNFYHDPDDARRLLEDWPLSLPSMLVYFQEPTDDLALELQQSDIFTVQKTYDIGGIYYTSQ